MSSTQTPPSGQTPTNGAPNAVLRRRRQADPLVRKKPPVKPSGVMPSAPRANGGSVGNGSVKPRPGPLQSSATRPTPAEAQEPYVDYPIMTTKRALLEGLRHHVIRFLPNSSSAVSSVDPADERQFTRPVRLHRRDPRANATGRWGEDEAGTEGGEENGKTVDDKERERLEILREKRREEREANQAQIAPGVKNPNQKRHNFQKKTEQVFQVSDTGDKKKNLQLRYEESIPWHLEDFDNNNIWSSSYEAALSECHVLMVPSQETGKNSFRMVPLEKWYKFTPKNLFKALSIEEAEARMGKRVKDPRWFMETQKASELKQKELADRAGGTRLFTRKGERGERMVKNEGDEEKPEMVADADDIDYNYDEAFADDEENPLFGGDDEENKEAEEKIKREQREANIFELKEQKDFEKEEEEAKRKAQEEKKLAKKVAKALMKREKNYVYEDDSEGNPYSSSSESEDSEVERQKEEERKKEEEKKAAQDKDKEQTKVNSGDKIPSGASSKGNTTPSGRPKHSDPLRKTLKRPGSPNLSENSGNESSRKKAKSSLAAAQASGANISRPNSPMEAVSSSSAKGVPTGRSTPRPQAGAGSDGELSDAGRRPTKLRLQSAQASRAASPIGSRAASPAPGAQAQGAPRRKEPPGLLPSAAEIRAAVPTEGISLSELIRKFGPAAKAEGFSALLRANVQFQSSSKMLFPRPAPATSLSGA